MRAARSAPSNHFPVLNWIVPVTVASNPSIPPLNCSSGAFLSANQDSSGTLEWIERKMAKVTAVPRNHGEVFGTLIMENETDYAVSECYECPR